MKKGTITTGTPFATYLRVSTQKQGKSGLGLDAQRKMCMDFINAQGGKLMQEFVDVESGTHRDRKGLLNAIEYCKKNGCGLVIAKLDRLARDVEFCFKVVNTGIEIHFTDMPTINTLLLGVFAAVAQYERELTSDRTRKALAVKKAQGARLGGANEKVKAWYANERGAVQAMSSKRGEMKSRRYKEKHDTVVFAKCIRTAFPNATTSESPKDWIWNDIKLYGGKTDEILGLMANYKEINPVLFVKWNFNDEKSSRKLYSYLQAFRNSYTKQ